MKMMGTCQNNYSGSTNMIMYVVKMIFWIVFCYMMYDIVFGNNDYDDDLKPKNNGNRERTRVGKYASIKGYYEDNGIVHEKRKDEQYIDGHIIVQEKPNNNEPYAAEDIVVNKKPHNEPHVYEDNIVPKKTYDKEHVNELRVADTKKEKADQTHKEPSVYDIEAEYEILKEPSAKTDDYEKSESYRILEEFKKYETLLKADNLDKKDNFELTNNKNTNLIINTYMRSGSSFLGKVFSMRSDTFYVYEPLWHIQKYAYYNGLHELCEYTRHKCVKSGRDAEKYGIGSSVKVHDALSFMDNLLHCNFKQNSKFLPDSLRFQKEFPSQKKSWNFSKGTSWDVYRACAKRRGSTYDSCFKEMQPVCKAKQHKVLKVLRTTLDNLEILIKSSPNLKVIQLFRDPRGIINSHLHTPFFTRRVSDPAYIERDIETMCDRMRIDVQIALHLRRVYKDQFLIVQYEDFGNLLFNAKALYKFMNMDISDDLEDRLQKLQYVGKDTKHAFHPYSYTESLPWSVERVVNKYCHQIFVALGYPAFQNSDEFRKFQPSPDNKLPYSLSNP